MAPRNPPADVDDKLEAEGDAAVEVEDAPLPSNAAVWLRASNGAAYEVNVVSEAYKRLMRDGAQLIGGPTDEESEVTDFAMLEKAKADARGSR